jgi:hypothetical protein|tara:strand:+ start:206 stop:2626 length:2421 start_codon:yes stop_codon:yes gene_type:complete
MPGFKIEKFFGKAPKIAPELLPNTSAQIASNIKLYSGDLIPYPTPVIVDNTERTGTIKKLHALRTPGTGELKWLSWLTDVDIATPSGAADADEQRFYYSGDGVPRVSTYALATTGSEPYPLNYYDLGLPLPVTVASVSAATFTTKATTHFSRDASGVVTLTTNGVHGLKSGALATVTGFTHSAGTYSQSGTTITVSITAHGLLTGAQVILRFTSGTGASGVYTMTKVNANSFTVTSVTSVSTSGNVEWDLRSFNARSIEVNAPTTTTLTYTSPGFQVAQTAFTAGSIDLAGTIRSRNYLYAWFTPWSEESIGSEPSEPLFIREGQVVTVTNLPTAKPSGNNFVRGIRLYRTVTGTSTADYLRIATLWFPTALASVQRTSNVSRVTTALPHNLAVGSYFKIASCSVSSFNIAGGEVTDIINDYIFEYAQTASNVSATSATGTLYIDSSENPGTDTARYWGESNYTFIDDFAVASLGNTLATSLYAPPPATLKGLTAIQNNVLAGFVNNEVYFSEPGQYHAWPEASKITLEDNVVGFALFSGTLVVMTDAYAYIVSGSDPAVFNVTRTDARFPCLAKNSIVNTGVGVMYATHDGIALYSTGTGAQLATKALYNSDTWGSDLDPSTLTGTYFNDAYFASHSNGSIIFELDEKAGGFFVDTTYNFTAAWYDVLTNILYYVNDTDGDIYRWDDSAQPLSNYTWKSKVIVSKNPLNVGAGRVVADYTANTTANWDNITDDWEDTTIRWDGDDEVTFRLYVDKALKFTTSLSSNKTFRLPSGYKSDTFEVEIESVVRVRSIHLADTPTALREV